MRITKSTFYDHRNCFLEDCERQYCREHRILYRDCETAIETYDGAGQTHYETRECPICVL